MSAVLRHLKVSGTCMIGIAIVVMVSGGSALGLFALAEHVRDYSILAGSAVIVGRYVLLAGALVTTILFFAAVVGPNLAVRLFSVRDKALTPEAVTDLRSKLGAAPTVSIRSGQGVLRIIPIKPGWWLDDCYDDDATPVVAVADVEHRLPGWHPYDVGVRSGPTDVVAWMPRASGNRGRRICNTIPVPQGRVTAVVFRPSSVPDLGGTLESLDSELTGKLSLVRLTLGATLLVGVAYGGWWLAAG